MWLHEYMIGHARRIYPRIASSFAELLPAYLLTHIVPLSQEAQDLLDSTAKSHSSRRRRREKEHRGDPVAAVNGPAPGEATDVNMALAAAEAQAIAAGAAPPAAEGGWGRDVDLGGADPDLDIAAAKFKPGIKFKLAS